MSLATESIGASLGTVPFHVKVLVLYGLRVNVCGAPVKSFFAFESYVNRPCALGFSSVFECDFHSESLGLCFINKPPPPHAKQVND